jgi:hypothetical protein
MAIAFPLPSPDDPVLLALQRAPLGEPFTPEQRAELDQDVADIAAGRAKLVPHAEVRERLDDLRRQQGG